MRFLKGVILLSAVSVGVAVLYVFGSLVGISGEFRLGVLARDGSGPGLKKTVMERAPTSAPKRRGKWTSQPAR